MSNFVKRARELEDEGNFEGALNYFEMAVEERTGPYDIRSEMGRVLNKLRRFDEALDYFDTVLIMDEEHIESLFVVIETDNIFICLLRNALEENL